MLTTEKFLEYSAKNIQGKANSMKVHLDASLLSFFNTKGSYNVKDKIIKFNSNYLHINDIRKTVSFIKKKKQNIIKGKTLL